VIGITLQQVLFGTTNWPTPIARSYAAVTSQVAERSVANIGDRLRPAHGPSGKGSTKATAEPSAGYAIWSLMEPKPTWPDSKETSFLTHLGHRQPSRVAVAKPVLTPIKALI
jgi:hypothetical protein